MRTITVTTSCAKQTLAAMIIKPSTASIGLVDDDFDVDMVQWCEIKDLFVTATAAPVSILLVSDTIMVEIEKIALVRYLDGHLLCVSDTGETVAIVSVAGGEVKHNGAVYNTCIIGAISLTENFANGEF